MIAVAFGLTPQDSAFETLREEFFLNYEERLLKSTYAFDGVDELIARICDYGLKWGVVTNKSARFTLPLTRVMSLFTSAQTIISGDTTAYSKPHPAPLLEAARQLGLPPDRCVYVGDDERDIIAGRAAGMLTVAAAYGYLGNVSDAESWNADFTIIKPSELLNLLKMT
ncbi:Similar to phosphoglycolate phosphatase, clustered with ubiquinone biosynthesis SAM-dependent O-methyltransferase [Polaromonas sp. CG9_12]|nr:Similar to phosphoglycolate phosphatase, clustered with ubiquinone biosynthesis SAM-dependent O-methyltransferase [Polaromonas sp. CG9_12]